MRRTVFVAALLAAAVVCLAPPQRRTFVTRAPSPSGELLVQRPEITWPIWSDDGIQVTDVRLELNDREVGAWYDHERREVVYRPQRPLAPGEYRAEVAVQLDGRQTTERSWTFRVRSDALVELPSLDDAQARALAEVNALRTAHGLEPATPCLSLHAASQQHADYMALNARADHSQTPGTTRFLAERPLDRARLFGVDRSVSEMVSRTPRGPQDALAGFMAAPYHRVSALRPGPMEVGTGFSGDYSCVMFTVGDAEQDVVSPPDGATDVPTSWDGVETPNPLRVGRLTAPVGPVASLTLYRRLPVRFTLVSARLTAADGREVDSFANHPGNDPQAVGSVFVIPRRPLQPGARYTVEIVLALADGRPVTHRWSFTTAR